MEKKNENVKRQEKDLINNAKLQAREILLNAKEDATEIIKQMHSFNNNKDLENARNTLNTKIKSLSLLDNDKSSSTLNIKNASLNIEVIQPNMEVFVTNLGQNGIVLSNVSKSNEVQVQIGNIKTNVNIKYLTLPKMSSKNNSSLSYNNLSHISKTKMIKSEINVIGLNVEEAIFVVDKFLDDCSLAKLQTARIVHGKGTGKLRNRYSSIFKSSSSC